MSYGDILEKVSKKNNPAESSIEETDNDHSVTEDIPVPTEAA